MTTRGPGRLRWHRPVELVAATVGGLVLSPLVAIATLAAAVSTRSSGVFRQIRVGRDAEPFTIFKLRTMKCCDESASTVTTAGDARITRLGTVIRELKIDELPQLLNVVKGEMSLVGPRPDVAGFADLLSGHDRQVLSVRPGISGPASVLLRAEEDLLAGSPNPERTNREVLFPLKTLVNRAWIEHGTLFDDVRLLLWTLRPPAPEVLYRHFDRWDDALRSTETFRRFEELHD